MKKTIHPEASGPRRQEWRKLISKKRSGVTFIEWTPVRVSRQGPSYPESRQTRHYGPSVKHHLLKAPRSDFHTLFAELNLNDKRPDKAVSDKNQEELLGKIDSKTKGTLKTKGGQYDDKVKPIKGSARRRG